MIKITQKDIENVLPELFGTMQNPGVSDVGLVIECYTLIAERKKYKVIARELYKSLCVNKEEKMKNDSLGIQTLGYDTELTLEGAKKRLEEVENAFNLIKRKYSDFLSGMKTEISKDDQKVLSDCIGVLLPLGMNHVVQQEIVDSKNPSETLHAKSDLLSQDIMLFLGRFKNSGVKILKGSPFGF